MECVVTVGICRFPSIDLLAALAGGTLIGAGAGIYCTHLGPEATSAIILNQKFNIRIGFFFYFNLSSLQSQPWVFKT